MHRNWQRINKIIEIYSKKEEHKSRHNYFSLNFDSGSYTNRESLAKRSISVKEREEIRHSKIESLHPINNKSKAVKGFFKYSDINNAFVK